MKRARWLGLPIGALIGACLAVRPIQIRKPETITAYMVVGAITGLLAAILLLSFQPNIERSLPAPRSRKKVSPLQWVFVVLNVFAVAVLLSKYLPLKGIEAYRELRVHAFLILFPFFSAGMAMLTCPDSTFSVVTARILLILFAILLALLILGSILFFGFGPRSLLNTGVTLLGMGCGWWLTHLVADSQRRRSQR